MPALVLILAISTREKSSSAKAEFSTLEGIHTFNNALHWGKEPRLPI